MPLFIAAGVSLGTVVFDQLLWALVLWLVLRTLRTGDGRGWLRVGWCAGISLETKQTMGMLGLGLAAAFVSTPTGPPSAHAMAMGGWCAGAGVPVAQSAVAAGVWLANGRIRP